jgi:uncharacterized C2H2 Zn-finger protein
MPATLQRTAVLRALDAGPDEIGQALAVLAVAGVAQPRALAVADGDRRLLAVHRQLTERDVELTIACPECGTVNETTLDVATLPETWPRMAPLGPGGGLRAPTYGDLLDLPPDPGRRRAELLRRCTAGAPSRAAEPADLERVDDSLTGPLILRCAGCDAVVESPLDVQRAVLESLVRESDAVDREVHLVASAYHWPLATIEALPDARLSRLAALIAEAR